MFCIERMAVHCVEGVIGCVSISEFDEGISVRARLVRLRCNVRWTLPMALPSLVVPWHGDIIDFDRGAFPCKLFHDF